MSNLPLRGKVCGQNLWKPRNVRFPGQADRASILPFLLKRAELGEWRDEPF